MQAHILCVHAYSWFEGKRTYGDSSARSANIGPIIYSGTAKKDQSKRVTSKNLSALYAELMNIFVLQIVAFSYG